MLVTTDCIHCCFNVTNKIYCLFYIFQYLTDLGCPFDDSDRNATIDWMLGYAVRLEYGDNGECSVFFLTSYSRLKLAGMLATVTWLISSQHSLHAVVQHRIWNGIYLLKEGNQIGLFNFSNLSFFFFLMVCVRPIIIGQLSSQRDLCEHYHYMCMLTIYRVRLQMLSTTGKCKLSVMTSVE